MYVKMLKLGLNNMPLELFARLALSSCNTFFINARPIYAECGCQVVNFSLRCHHFLKKLPVVKTS